MFDFAKYPIIENQEALTKAAKRHVKAYARLKEETHQLLVSFVNHAVRHGSADLLSNFWNDLPMNANKRGILIWIKEFTTLNHGLDKAGSLKFKGIPAWKPGEAGKATPFWAMPKVKKDAAMIPFEQAFNGLLERYGKRKDKLAERDAGLFNTMANAFHAFEKKHPRPAAVN